ncbi:hypothetical protein KR093_002901 [Drosophila rubida]|uniref:Uncharacterized protein n=1 Tax=Drosophila rubida TaxID=30044 RepID=A0AAD4JUD6_9MUSC|nr:hypothetical protein KR093_002901 [Drosophila rubida]
MNCELKPMPVAGKLLQLNVTSEEEQQQQTGVGDNSKLSEEESQLLLQKLSINNPFYRFRKQSNSLKELRRLRRRKRRSRSEADLQQQKLQQQKGLLRQQLDEQHQHNEAKVVVVLDSKQYLGVTNPSSRQQTISLKTRSVSSLRRSPSPSPSPSPTTTPSPSPGDNSTVITNPFSIFHDDEILTLGVNPRLRSANSATAAIRANVRPQRSSSGSRGLRRLFESNTNSGGRQATPTNPHYLHGVPVRRFERQDFTEEAAASKPKRTRALFKQLSLRKLHRPEEPPSLPKLKLSYRYPNRTQSIQSMRAAGSGGYDIQHTAYRPRLVATTPKSNYFERLQAKTRQGIQKIRDKCRNFKAQQSDASSSGGGSEFSGFHTLAKDESFRFISDRAHISNYESRCAAAQAAGKQAAIYKSYKSEIDLSKNLHYLEHYLEQNFEQQLGSSKQSAHSVGRISGAQRRALAAQQQLPREEEVTATRAAGRRHKRSLSQAVASNYENLGTLPISARATRGQQSDSLSSSDYASVFSGPTAAAALTEPPSRPEDEHEVERERERESEREREREAVLKLRYEHPDKMCEYYFDNLTSYALGLEESEDLLLAESAKSARFFYDDDDEDEDDDVVVDVANVAGVEELVDEETARQLANESDYMARDIRIRINMNECEDEEDAADWQRRKMERDRERERERERNPASRTSYNENLAESTFYQSLNQHLQRQAIAVDGQQPHRAIDRLEKSSLEEAPLGGESYLAHFQRSRSRSDFERLPLRHNEADIEQQLYARGEYYGFGGEATEVVYAAKQRRADLMEAHYARSHHQPATGSGSGSKRYFMAGGGSEADTSYKRSHALRTAATSASAANDVAGMPATDALYATSSKQLQQQQQQQLHKAEPAAGGAGGGAAAAIAAATTPSAASTTMLSAGNANTNTSANNRYMLENLRKYYANQQQHPPAHSVNSSSLSNSSSSNSSMSQQQQQQQKLHLPTASHISKQQLHLQQQLQQQQHAAVARRNSSTSNASSTADNFDTFIALRNAAGASAAAAVAATTPSTDYMGKRRSQQTPHATATGAPLISALNYYGHGGATPTAAAPSIGSSSNGNANNILTYNGKLSATAMLSQVNLGRSAAALQQQLATPTAAATAASTSKSAGAAFAGEKESFILEYEC